MTAAKISSALLLALCATAARADWEGDVEMKMSDRPGRGGPEAMPPGGGKIRFKEGKLRMDVQMGPMSMTTLVDFAARKVFIINDGARQYVEHDTEASRAGQDGMPHCKTQNFIECMKEQGFKKVGSGEANGQACTIWEGERKTARGTRHEKLWHPDAAGEEFAMVRSQGSGEQGPRSEFNVLNFKMTKQDPKYFQVPEGYTKSEGFFPGMSMPPGMKRPPHTLPVEPKDDK